MSVNTENSLREGYRETRFGMAQEPWLAPEGTMDIVLESLRQLIDYELAVILSFEGKDTLRVRTMKGPLATRRLADFSISLLERRDLALLLAAGEPRLLATERGFVDTYAEILDLPEGHSCLAAPLTVEGTPIGLLTFDHRTCGVFSEQILRFIGVISRLIAVALAQSEASRNLRDRNRLLLEERNRLLSRDAEAFRDLAGTSPVWMEALDAIKLVAATESPVLLLGETGTGKEEAARAIHTLSARAAGPFVAVNCSALPASLAESELFGHEKGSFTGAQALRKGRFELSHGGTLFLDEIGDLPLEIQPKILRALQEGRFERVGGESSVSVDVRIVAATHVDLGAAVEAGTFREDLFYRVAVFPIRMPPLRERGQDSILIAELFAARLRTRPGWQGLAFSAEALDLIARRDWPGNVRELRNAVERAAILAKGGVVGTPELSAGDWAQGRAGGASGHPGPGTCADPGPGQESTFGTSTLRDAEHAHIRAALARARGRIYGPDGAAAALGLPPSTLQSRVKKLGLDPKEYR